MSTLTFGLYLFTVYKAMTEAVKKHPEADILINFASLRSAYDASMEALDFNQVGSVQGREVWIQDPCG